jgi:hypothetical protein
VAGVLYVLRPNKRGSGLKRGSRNRIASVEATHTNQGGKLPRGTWDGTADRAIPSGFASRAAVWRGRRLRAEEEDIEEYVDQVDEKPEDLYNLIQTRHRLSSRKSDPTTRLQGATAKFQPGA